MAEDSYGVQLDIGQRLLQTAQALETSKKSQGTLTQALLGTEEDLLAIAKQITKEGKLRNAGAEDLAEKLEETLEQNEKINEAIADTFPGVMNLVKGVDKFASTLRALAAANPLLALLAVGIALFKVFSEFQKAVTNTRKELGVSYGQAVAITAQNKALAQVAKGFGLTQEDIVSAQAAIRKDLGASVQEAVNLSLEFARTAAATGQTSEQLTSTLSIMESISSSSRDVLLNQIRTNAAMIQAAGVAPALVMKDIATNAEFFASFAKDGGKNLIGAGIAARKLGLDMDSVKGITESLLDFETSIEASMEASLLLGRQINTDKARQLAFTGDQEGLMKEIQRLVGSEAEFTRMSYIQRQSLAKSVGVSVEQLSRLVRNNTAGGTAGAVGAAVAGASNVFSDPEQHRLTNKLIRVME